MIFHPFFGNRPQRWGIDGIARMGIAKIGIQKSMLCGLPGKTFDQFQNFFVMGVGDFHLPGARVVPPLKVVARLNERLR